MFLSPASNFRISLLLGIFPLPKSRNGPHYKLMYPGAANPFPDAGTWRRTSEGLSAAVRQPLSCHGACRVFLARLEAMPPADIRMVLFRVPALKIAYTQKCPLKFRQLENPCFLGYFPFRFLCRQSAAQRKETEQ